MIHHLSISVNNPAHVAEVLAQLMGGYSYRFPASPGAYMAMQLDDFGTMVEVYPAGTELHPGKVEDGFGIMQRQPRDPPYVSTHFALSVKSSSEEIFAIMAKEDWLCRRHDRAQFPVIEVWIENIMMFELLPPEFARKYLEVAEAGRRKALAGQDPFKFGPPPEAAH
jgi:hypothetical protein